MRKSPFDENFEFCVTVKNGGVCVSLSATLLGEDYLMLLEPYQESSEQLALVFSRAIETTALEAASAAYRAHGKFLQALDSASLQRPDSLDLSPVPKGDGP